MDQCGPVVVPQEGYGVGVPGEGVDVFPDPVEGRYDVEDGKVPCDFGVASIQEAWKSGRSLL